MQSEKHVIYRCHTMQWNEFAENDFEDFDLILREASLVWTSGTF